jgi:Ran GTPase-activating protein (RanGAP) involved in mRNA processing and transport
MPSPEDAHSPPLHPRQKFHQICGRIKSNDESLTCIDFRCQGVNLQALGDALRYNKHVQDLALIGSLGRDDRVPGSDDIQSLFLGIASNTALKSLNLSENNLGPNVVQHLRGLREAIEHHPSLEKLVLNKCHIHQDGLQVLVGKLARITNLELSRNALATTSSGILLSRNALESTSSGALLCRLLQCNSNHLKRLDLSQNQLGAEGCAELVASGCHSLEMLNLSGNGIDHVGAAAVGEAIGNACCLLTTMQLGQNPLGDEGITALAKGIERNSSLQILCLRHSDMGDAGALRLARALEHHRLVQLTLTRNRIGLEGALALMTASRHTKRRLDFQRNRIDGGLDLVQELREHNDGVEFLDVHFNQVGVRHCREIRYWTSLNAAGRRVLRNPRFPRALWALLLSKASKNPEILYYFLRQKPEICCGPISR